MSSPSGSRRTRRRRRRRRPCRRLRVVRRRSFGDPTQDLVVLEAVPVAVEKLNGRVAIELTRRHDDQFVAVGKRRLRNGKRDGVVCLVDRRDLDRVDGFDDVGSGRRIEREPVVRNRLVEPNVLVGDGPNRPLALEGVLARLVVLRHDLLFDRVRRLDVDPPGHRRRDVRCVDVVRRSEDVLGVADQHSESAVVGRVLHCVNLDDVCLATVDGVRSDVLGFGRLEERLRRVLDCLPPLSSTITRSSSAM
ncbi:hypothetical protein D8S78_07035 [Natrialba swarupiae]|nr:hypothetical protein [Natrialba swarupiae]